MHLGTLCNVAPAVRARASRAAVAFAFIALVATGAGAARPVVAQQDGLVVRQLEFQGNESLAPELLAASIATTNSGWFARTAPFRWFGLGERRYFSEVDFQRDVLRLEVLYKQSGFPDVQVDTLVRRTPEDIYLTFLIEEGEPIRVDTFTVHWLDSVPAEVREEATVDLPLREGDVFNRIVMQAAADTITRRLRDRGYPSADVLVSYRSRTEERLAAVTLDAQAGQHAVIGSVRVDGESRVDSSVVVALMRARPGREFSQTDLFTSQRNLYNSDLFRLAAVSIDTMAFVPGSDTVPLAVQVTELPPRRATAGVGYGTNDCFRGSAGIMFRNFLGEGRILDLSSRISKVGIGEPLNWGLENSPLCDALREDSIGSRLLNYNVTASVRRPAFLSPNNTLIFSTYAERRSEFKVYRRQEIGASIGVTRETPTRRLPVALTYTMSFGRTEASPFSFCAFFNTCLPSDVEFRSRRRRLATVSLTGTVPRANNPLDPTRGYVATGELTVASRFIGSSSVLQFTRVVADYAWYRPIARDVVFSWRVRGGLIFSPVRLEGSDFAFVPPEERFYGGGPNDVRGYQRNELGPVVYVVSREYLQESVKDPNGELGVDSVRVAATGGNSLATANVELRFPSPIFKERMRLALFADAGGVWERGATDVLIRVTPGAGIRVATPLGPARFDIAWNPSRLAPGAFYIAETDGTLTPDPSRQGFQLDRKSHFTLHFAVGQPF
ncbi:MAG TPA: BamA/TamA family outer membrane protein [Gemmatimonadales bacterium]